jgi:hypothetical protein
LHYNLCDMHNLKLSKPGNRFIELCLDT